MRQTAAFAATLFLAVVIAGGEARAELPRPYGETQGFTLEIGFGGNGLTDDDYIEGVFDADVDPLVGLFLAGAYRLSPYISLGLVGHFAFLRATSDLDDEFSAFFAMVFETQGHLPIGRLDPWIGLGVGYATAFSNGHEHVELPIVDDYDFDGSMALHGVAFSLGLGLDIWITRHLALAPYFRMFFGVYPTGCWEYTDNVNHEDECDDVEEMYGVDDPDDLPDLPHLWSAGVMMSYII